MWKSTQSKCKPQYFYSSLAVMSRCCFRPVVAGVVGVGLCCAISNVGADVGAVVGAVVGANSGQNYIGGPNLQSPPSVECATDLTPPMCTSMASVIAANWFIGLLRSK